MTERAALNRMARYLLRIGRFASMCMLVIGAAQFSVAVAAPEDPEDGGSWGPILNWPFIVVSAANLPDGNILTYSGSERETWPTPERTYSSVWNPATGNHTQTLHFGHNMFCAHLAMMEDGGGDTSTGQLNSDP